MISAKIICDSISEAGTRLTTMEVEVPRIVWCELLTHGMLSRNAASSRAIPFAKMGEQLTGKPVRFGKNVSGMQDGGEHNALINGSYTAEEWWHLSKLSATRFAQGFAEAGYAKQIFNRITEPYQVIKGVITATEWDNFFWLRNHEAADPTLHELASCMYEAREKSTPQLLKAGEWHLPFVQTCRSEIDNETLMYFILDDDESAVFLELEDAIKVSCARSAAVSFRNTDYGLDKSREVYARLIGDERKHASAMEHCATPMQEQGWDVDSESGVNVPTIPSTWEPGISHMDRDGNLWSGKFKSWIQHRKLIPGENYTGK